MARLATIVVSFCLANALWWGGARFLLTPPEDARSTYELIQAKEAIAAASPARERLLIVGGSSSRYGYSAKQLSTLTGFSAVNLASHAGLGNRYILDRAKRSLQSGDTVLLALESARERPATYVTARIVQFETPSYILRAPFSEWPSLIFGVTPHDVLRSWLRVQILGNMPSQTDENGDQTGISASLLTESRRAAVAASGLAASPPQTVGELAKVVHEFVAWCNDRGVQVVIGWPTILYREAYFGPQYRPAYDKLAESFAELGLTTIGRQTDFLLSAEHMFDTNYHPNDIGRSIATRKLAELLCQQVRCPHPAAYAVEKPQQLATPAE